MPHSTRTRYIVVVDLQETAGQDVWCTQLVETGDIFHKLSDTVKQDNTIDNKDKDKNKNRNKNKLIDWTSEDYRYSQLTLTPIQMDAMPSVPLKSKYLGYGVVRLFREYDDSKSNVDETTEVEVESDDTTVAIVAIPAYFSPTDLLGFIGERATKDASHMRMIKADDPNRVMVLMKFRTSESARNFQESFNGRSFNSMESEVCHVISVKSVLFKPLNLPKDQLGGVPYLMEDPFTLQMKKLSIGETSTIVKELPTCPVCLDRMDSDITGLLTISCQHTFHCNCLSKWRDDSCPVCRYSNLALGSVKQYENQICSSCGGTDNLWVCLICGNVGCGRYDSKHAIEHYESTNHCFAMDLSTQRVWDYAGDNYVHRLLQNEADGKLVELPSSCDTSINGGSGAADHSKDKSIEASTEYTDVLLSQLESQREYYESRLAEAVHASSLANYKKETDDKFADIETKFNSLLDKSVKSANKLKGVAQVMEQKWKEEKALSENLTANVERLKQENKDLKEKNEDLEAQLKDLMFYLESREKFQDASEEVKNGTILVQEPILQRKVKSNGKKKR